MPTVEMWILCIQRADNRLLRIHPRSAFEAEATELQIKPATGQTERFSRFRNVAAMRMKRAFNHFAFELIDGDGEGRSRSCPAGPCGHRRVCLGPIGGNEVG